MTSAYPSETKRMLITASVMLAAVMHTLDGTIANVALPQIQSSVAASQEQIVWVLTSFLIATASQATLLDINPPERHGPAMAIYGLATMLGPVVGPLLGGWLTDTWSWRWAFLINVPCGIVAFVGMSRVMPETRMAQPSRFDMMGFATLAVFLASLQLMLDRGPQLDWFDSWEVRIEAVVMAVFGYLTIVHTFTAHDPFIRPTLFRDRNFLFGSLMSAQLGVLVFAVIPLITTMLQQLMRYPVMLTGMVTAPRGIGTMISMIAVAKVITKVDKRVLIFIGLVLSATGMYQMSHFSLYMDERVVVVSGLLQGLASGFIFVPLSILVFSTIDPHHRNAGSALFALTRNVGASVGVSVLQVMTIHNSVTVQSRLAEAIRPDNPVLALRAPDLDFDAPATIAGMEREIERQAAMVGYVDSYWFLFILTLVMMPIALSMQSSRRQSKA